MLRSAGEPIALHTPTEWDDRGTTKPEEGRTRNSTYILKSTHTTIVPDFFWGGSFQPLWEWMRGLLVSRECLGLSGGLPAAAAPTQSVGCLYCFVPSSLGFLLGVSLLLQPLGVALGRGVDDGNDKVADHDQHHLLKHPWQPVLILETQGGWTINYHHVSTQQFFQFMSKNLDKSPSMITLR